MNNSWNLEKLKKQAIGNQNFDEYVLNESEILKYEDLKVLDVGCSNGFKTKMLFDKYDNITHITGIDIDNNAINEATDIFRKNKKYKFELKSIDELDYNSKYDIIYLSYVLQHLEEPQKVLKKLRNLLTDRGIIIIKVPDDSFKFCYPDKKDLLHKIFNLYENQIMKKQDITKYTDRYIGKKVYNYLVESDYNNIKLYYSISDTIGKTREQRLSFFDSSIGFRSAINKKDVSEKVKNKMEELLNELKKEFEKEEFYYTMTALYYIASK